MSSDRAHGDGIREAYGERAETYLRLLAEAALRSGPAAGQHDAGKVARAADLLIEAGVLTEERAAWVLLDLTTALRARDRRDPPWTRPYRGGLRRLAALAGKGQAPLPPEEWRVFPGPAAVPGAHVMALILAPGRALAPATLTFPPSAGIGDLQAAPWADLTVADGAGTPYRTTFAYGSWAGSTWTGTIMLRPAPPAHAGWIKISIPNGFSLLVPLPDPPPALPVLPEPVSDSPGERLLTRHAEALLATLPSPHAGRLPPGERAFPELAATLSAAGALPPLSPVPRQVAALRALLCPPSPAATAASPRPEAAPGPGAASALEGCSPGDLPARWLNVVAHYGRRRRLPPTSGTGAIGAPLPGLDGARFAIAGLHSGPAGTLLHVVASGLRALPQRVPPGMEAGTGFSWWLRDDLGAWHLACIEEASPAATETVLRMALLPPLTHRTATLTAEVTGLSARVTATVAVRW